MHEHCAKRGSEGVLKIDGDLLTLAGTAQLTAFVRIIDIGSKYSQPVPVFLRVTKFMVILALMFSIGAHWALLQTLAWTGMIISYSQDATLAEAISMTFDGEHPCKMCKVVKEGRKSEQEKPAVLKAGTKFDLFFPMQGQAVYAPVIFRDSPLLSSGSSSRRDPPLLRPPIFA